MHLSIRSGGGWPLDGLVGKWLSNLAGDRLFCRKSSSALILANWHFEEANRGQGKATRVLDLLERDVLSGGLKQVMYKSCSSRT